MLTPTTSSLAHLLDSFFRQRLIAQRRCSPATVATYRDAIRLLLVFVAHQRVGREPSRLTLEDLDRDAVLAYLDHLEQDRGNSVRTRNNRLAAVRSFFRHVTYEDPGSIEIAQRILSIPNKRAIRRTMTYLTTTELDALLDAPDRTTTRGRRDYALLLFLARTGARASEAIGLDAADVRYDRPCHVLLRGKGSKERVVPLSTVHAAVLHALRAERGLAPSARAPIFVNAQGERLTRFGVVHVVHGTVAIASRSHPSLAVRRISPHTLRHTAAMHLLQSGVDLVTIQSWLGHASPDTTHHYVQADLEMKRRALEKCDDAPDRPSLYQPPDDVLALLDAL